MTEATTLRPIDPAPFRARTHTLSADPGPLPTLQWIAIDKLRVDASYQRAIESRGAKNVVAIAERFDWSKFTPVIVAHTGGGIYAIIDGQHRTTAALLRGIAKVPCQEVEADRIGQAAAFAAINGQVTALTPMQLHAARLAAGDTSAKELAAICARAGVSICRYPVPASAMKPGETLAVGTLATLLTRYGQAVLVAALSCVSRTRDGNPGLLRAPLIGALCGVLDAEPAWHADMPALVQAMQSFDFPAQWSAAGQQSYAERCSISSALVDRIALHLASTLGE